MSQPAFKTYVRRSVAIAAWIFAGILGIIILALAALQFHDVQSAIARRAVSFLSEKTGARIEIGSVDIAFTHSVVLHNICVQSRRQDTIVSVQTLAIDVNLLTLFSREITVTRVQIDSLNAHITRTLPDSSYNFDFILNAFGPDSADAGNGSDPSASAPWKIRLDQVDLNGVRCTYDDDVGGLTMDIRLGTLAAPIDMFDLETMQFHVGELSLVNTAANIRQTKKSPSDTAVSADIDIGFRSLSLSKIRFNYDNIPAGEHFAADIGSAFILAEKIDLPSRCLVLKKILLEKSAVVVTLPPGKENKKEKIHAVGIPWVITLDQMNLNGNSVHYDIRDAPKMKGVNSRHLHIEGLTMKAEHLFYGGNRIAADFRHTVFREQSGLEIRELSGGIVLDSLHIRLTDFTVETVASRIHLNALIRYTSFFALKEFPGTAQVNADIDESRIAVSDMLFFNPALPLNNRNEGSIQLSSALSGSVGDLRIEALHIAAGDSAAFDLSGSIRGLPDASAALYNLELRISSSGRNSFQSFIPDTLIPNGIVIPPSISAKGNFKGTFRDFSAASDIATSFGRVTASADLATGNGTPARRWKTDIVIDDFNIGLLLNDPVTFGTVSLKAAAAGRGITKEDIEANVHVNVDNAMLLGYRYRNLSLNGIATPKMFEGNAEIQDSNIVFTFNGIVNTGEKDPTYKFTFDLKGADLHRLHLMTDDFRVSGIITSDLTGRDIDTVDGTLEVRDVVIIKNNKRYTIDSLVYASIHNLGQTHISLESTLFAAQFDGTVSPGDLPEVLRDHFSQYFAFKGNTRKKNLQPQAFQFTVSVRDPATLTEIFIPELKNLTVGNIEGNFNSRKKTLNVNVDIPAFEYSTVRIDSALVSITSDSVLMQASVKIGSIADSTLQVTNFQLTAKAEHDSLDIAVQSTRSDGFVKMYLAGLFKSAVDGYTFRFNNDGVILQGIPWAVPPDNLLSFGMNRLIAHNIRFQNGGESCSLASVDEKVRHSPLKIECTDFDVAGLSQIVEREKGLIGGILRGNVVLQNLETKMSFTSDMSLANFKFLGRSIGDITLHANNQTENVYEMKMDISGNGNQIGVNGRYRSREGGNVLDLVCDFTKVNLAAFEPFTFGNVQRLSGTMTGGLHLTGTLKNPVVAGKLNFTNAAFTPSFLDTYLHLNDGTITIDSKGIEFGSFVLVDTLGNTASLSGNLFTEDFRSYSYDIRVRMNNFLLLNKPAGRDALYYGTLILDSDISIKGDQKKQTVVMQAELGKGTDLALVLPESELAVEERRGIIRFVDRNHLFNTIMSRRNAEINSDTADMTLSSFDLTANVTVDKNSRLRILIDPIAGDSLVIQGEAALSFTMDPGGKITLTGRYEIIKGSYQLSFGDFIRKEFAIAKGSSLTWLGSPFDADVDITAIYTVRTTVFDLLQSQLTGVSQEERTKYKQEIPIQVYLMMKGKLLTPNIHFKLDLPPETRGILNGTVYAKLNELNGKESELNKQVFALLVLGRFIAESPLASAAGNDGLTDFARSSASQILSAQLNRLSEQYIKGVSLNVGVDSYRDYSTGNAEGRTQLKLALSKQLFNERVTVQAGGNVDVEGERSRENSLNNFAGDLKVMYKLTEDGRWQMQVFRQNSYEGAIDGDVVKTGVGIVFTLDFDKLFGIMLKPVADGEKK